ncbi:hypothetical protein CRD60_08260 [Bifidobacterium aemilianum]|uniref:ABC-2 type transporter transmembrane domain-containing protein n=1 Tax=Bifidobacterium aemilianum TaxID=2493120 RepID=A0A366K602_9BIFI|nr:ABC transporter permease [Bifidobacterium aemilianum]RBP97165.1 hypothetical protein CRD60_08260 [Bifidobacterium aemilianum]
MPPSALTVVFLLTCGVLTLVGLLNDFWSSTEEMAMSLNNILGMLLAGIGGALSPVSGFPGWAQHLAAVSPVYWAMDAIGAINFDSADLAAVRSDISALLAFLLALAVLAAVLFKRGIQRKE